MSKRHSLGDGLVSFEEVALLVASVLLVIVRANTSINGGLSNH